MVHIMGMAHTLIQKGYVFIQKGDRVQQVNAKQNAANEVTSPTRS